MNEHVLHSNLYTVALVLSSDGLDFGIRNILAKVQTSFSATRTPAFVKILLIFSEKYKTIDTPKIDNILTLSISNLFRRFD